MHIQLRLTGILARAHFTCKRSFFEFITPRKPPRPSKHGSSLISGVFFCSGLCNLTHLTILLDGIAWLMAAHWMFPQSGLIVAIIVLLVQAYFFGNTKFFLIMALFDLSLAFIAFSAVRFLPEIAVYAPWIILSDSSVCTPLLVAR